VTQISIFLSIINSCELTELRKTRKFKTIQSIVVGFVSIQSRLMWAVYAVQKQSFEQASTHFSGLHWTDDYWFVSDNTIVQIDNTAETVNSRLHITHALPTLYKHAVCVNILHVKLTNFICNM
jgi:hypothetical protein